MRVEDDSHIATRQLFFELGLKTKSAREQEEKVKDKYQLAEQQLSLVLSLLSQFGPAVVSLQHDEGNPPVRDHCYCSDYYYFLNIATQRRELSISHIRIRTASGRKQTETTSNTRIQTLFFNSIIIAQRG